MKKEYWDVSDEQVVDKTGRKISTWIAILDKFKASEKKSNEVVAFLQNEHEVPRYWARTLTTLYSKKNKGQRPDREANDWWSLRAESLEFKM